MNEIVVDTCVWIEFFGGRNLASLEAAFKEGRVRLSPLVAAELLSGARTGAEQKQLKELLLELEMPEYAIGHWFEVGALRQKLIKKGFHISTPDAHVAQAAIECDGFVYSFDKIFQKISSLVSLKVISE